MPSDITPSARIDEVLRDSDFERSKYVNGWSTAKKLYEGYHNDVYNVVGRSAEFYTSANRIKLAVQNSVAVQTETRPEPNYVGVESNEPPEIYLSETGAGKVELLSEQELGGYQFSPEELSGEVPIPDGVYRQLASLSTPQEVPRDLEQVKLEAEIYQMQMGSGENAKPQQVSMTDTVQAPMFDESDFVMITDEFAAQALTEEAKRQWNAANGHDLIRTNIFEKAVLGEKDTLIQWDAEKNNFTLQNLYNYDVWFDRLAHGSHDQRFCLIRVVYDYYEAMRLYPQVPDEVFEKNKGILDRGNSYGSTKDRYNRQGDRDFIAVWHLWEKDYPFPLDPEQAIEQGLIQPAMDEQEIVNEDGTVDAVSVPITDDSGEPMYVTAEGEATAYGDDLWPQRYGIRQLTMIGDQVVADEESEFSDIPVSRNINQPRVETPYGEGDPEILQPLQKMLNKLYSIMQEHYHYFRQPNRIMAASVADQLKAALKKVHADAITQIAVPDHIVQNFGVKGGIDVLQPPQISQAIIALIQQVQAEMDILGGNVEAMRGQFKSETSGRALAAAQNAARGVIGFKARYTQGYLEYMSRIIANLIIDFLPEEEWAARSKKYPKQVIAAIKRRLKRFGYDIKVQVGGVDNDALKQDLMTTMVQQIPGFGASPTALSEILTSYRVDKAERIAQEVSGATVQLNQRS